MIRGLSEALTSSERARNQRPSEALTSSVRARHQGPSEALTSSVRTRSFTSPSSILLTLSANAATVRG
jgi:hypothetical protein